MTRRKHLIVTLEISVATSKEVRSFLQSTKSPTSTAISVPEDMTMPTFALARAGASFVPSPTNATFRDCFCLSLIIRSLSSGLDLAKILC